MKKILCCILSISLILSVLVLPVNKVFADSDPEQKSMQRLMDLGIFSKTDADKMYLSEPVTREQLAVVLVMINGQQDKLDLYKNTSLFGDVPASRWSNPYINVAARSGYMKAKNGNIFSPTEKVTFSSVAEILCKLLKYDDIYLPGSTNEKYLRKLDGLGILDKINYSPSAYVTRGQIALMLDRLLSTRVFGTDKKFIDTVSSYKSAIVLENSIINKNSDERQIYTDKGFFFLKDGVAVPEAGKQYHFNLKDNDIQYAALSDYQYKEYSVSSFISGTLATNSGEKVKLPAGIPYYYKGNVINYSDLSPLLEKNSSVIIAYDGDKFVYGAVFDPLKSDPEVITASNVGISLGVKYSGLIIDRGGKYVTGSQIEVNDVVYRISDIWNTNAYLIVYENTIKGKITSILPSKMSPDIIEIDGNSYTLDASFNKYKIKNSDTIQVGETVKLVLGNNGKVVDIISSFVKGTENYVLVLNAFSNSNRNTVDYIDSGKYKKEYYVTLLHADGEKETYLSERSMLHLKGKLALYKIIKTGEDYDTVELQIVNNNALKSYKINKDERMIGNDYVADGAVLFNIEKTYNDEIEASVISFNDISETRIMDGAVKYIHKSGDFMDIDVMLLDDALGRNTAYGLVTDMSVIGNEYVVTEKYTLLVNGQMMTYIGRTMTYAERNRTAASLWSVVRIKLNENNVDSIKEIISSVDSSREVQAVDSSRIRINDKVYSYHNNMTIYKLTSDLSWKAITPNELKKGFDNGNVSLYLDRPLNEGGKVVAIVVR